jgi:hypothetical protein
MHKQPTRRSCMGRRGAGPQNACRLGGPSAQLSLPRCADSVCACLPAAQAIEACGSKSGQTSVDVMIAGCGVLPKGGSSSGPSAGAAKPTASLAGGAQVPQQVQRGAGAAGATAAARLAHQWRVSVAGRRLALKAARRGWGACAGGGLFLCGRLWWLAGWVMGVAGLAGHPVVQEASMMASLWWGGWAGGRGWERLGQRGPAPGAPDCALK